MQLKKKKEELEFELDAIEKNISKAMLKMKDQGSYCLVQYIYYVPLLRVY